MLTTLSPYPCAEGCTAYIRIYISRLCVQPMRRAPTQPIIHPPHHRPELYPSHAPEYKKLAYEMVSIVEAVRSASSIDA
eukprot:scaffold19909_cov130-Isochrysis_galbana.AAC.1